MPMTLITGLPGNGKTLYALWYVKRLAEKEGRPVFYARIKGLTLPWTKIDPFEWMHCPANAIVVIDECQQSNDPMNPDLPSLFGVRQRGSKVPPWAAALEVHRHLGIDLVLITQDPMLIDGHDRKLVQWHYHIVRTFGLQRATVHKFGPGTRDNVAKSRTGSIREEWTYPREVYTYYESAEKHTIKSSIPTRVWVLLAIPPLVVGLAWYTWVYHLDPKRNKLGRGHVGSTAQAPGAAAGAAPSAKLTPAEYVHQFAPRVEGLAYTAPAYDEITKPVAAPYPAACIKSATRCSCYTQQGTALKVTPQICEDIAVGGFFVAWAQPVAQAIPLAKPQEAANSPVPALVGGYASIGRTPRAETPSASILPPPPTGEQLPPGRGRNLPPPGSPGVL